jgi:hypothetical protein
MTVLAFSIAAGLLAVWCIMAPMINIMTPTPPDSHFKKLIRLVIRVPISVNEVPPFRENKIDTPLECLFTRTKKAVILLKDNCSVPFIQFSLIP